MNKPFNLIAMDTEELSDMNRQIRRMCHDLNAPLRAVHGFADILQRREAENLSEKGRMYLQRMVIATQSMEQIVSRLHLYARLSTHKVKPSPVPIAQLTGEIISEQYRNLPQGTNLHWHTHADLIWISDPFLLETIVQELLSNALLFCIPPAQVTIAWNLIDNELVLTVSDQGIGIAPEYQQRVFNLFERLHGRDSYPGAGVGLTMVLRAVSLLNGRIELASETDQGTQIRVSLPLVPINPT